MIFMIYRGKSEGEDDGLGSFTKGKLYIAKSEVDNNVVDIQKLKVTDDDQNDVWVEPENDRFEYPEEVYGVIVKALGSKSVGEVVVVDGADEDGFLSVKGMGYIRAANVQLLDSVILAPSMMVYDRERMKWDTVSRIDECMNLRVEGCDSMKKCTDFIFAVSDGDITTVPLMKCLDDAGRENLTKDRIYRVVGLDDDGMLVVKDDAGEECSFDPERFEFV